MFGNGLPGRNKRRFIGKGIVGYARYMKFKRDLNITRTKYIVKKRLDVLVFFEKYGLEATIDAFKVSKSTIYLWRKRYKDFKHNVFSLIPKSTRPKRTRRMCIDKCTLNFIQNLRERNHRFGKTKIKILLDEYCDKEGLTKITESTIGKIIKRNNWFFNPDFTESYVHDFTRNNFRKKSRKPKRYRLSPRYKAKYPGEVIQIDTIIRFDYHIKQYILTAVDLCSRFCFAFSYQKLSSRIALDFYQKLEQVVPFKITSVKTDNGLEFLGEFDNYLTKHFFSYPRCPKSNAYVERFNRTIQEEFVEANLDCIDNLHEFNSRLINYLIFVNSVSPHQSLDYLTPMGYLTMKDHFSNMSVTNTKRIGAM